MVDSDFRAGGGRAHPCLGPGTADKAGTGSAVDGRGTVARTPGPFGRLACISNRPDRCSMGLPFVPTHRRPMSGLSLLVSDCHAPLSCMFTLFSLSLRFSFFPMRTYLHRTGHLLMHAYAYACASWAAICTLLYELPARGPIPVRRLPVDCQRGGPSLMMKTMAWANGSCARSPFASHSSPPQADFLFSASRAAIQALYSLCPLVCAPAVSFPTPTSSWTGVKEGSPGAVAIPEVLGVLSWDSARESTFFFLSYE